VTSHLPLRALDAEISDADAHIAANRFSVLNSDRDLRALHDLREMLFDCLSP
jgi:hypothetical protein